MNIVPIPITVIDNGISRRLGWRAALADQGVTVWRCERPRAHYSSRAADACGLTELRARLGRRGMKVWAATYRPKQQYTEAEMTVMNDARELVVMDLQTSMTTGDIVDIPRIWEEAVLVVEAAERAMFDARNIENIRHHQDVLEVIKAMHRHNQEARYKCMMSFLCGEWVIGGWLKQDEENESSGTAEIIQLGMRGTGGSAAKPPVDVPTLAEKIGGSRTYAWRLKELADISVDQLRTYGLKLKLSRKEPTLFGIVELKRTDETRARRRSSLYGTPFPEGMKYLVGDCREVLADIKDNSVAAIITDPPYTTDAEPLYVWLAEFADRVLVPGGSLICYTGQGKTQSHLSHI